MRMSLLATLLCCLPGLAFAAGGGDTAPKPTETTKDCFKERQWDPDIKKWVRFSEAVNGVWDPDLRKCIRPDKAAYLDSNLLIDAVREMAYAGRYESAQDVLRVIADQDNDVVQTYWGFTHRKLGNVEAAMMFYTTAIAENPDNLLARSYMGQGLVTEGDLDGARAQLAEIEARGDADGWPAVSLRRAILTGTTYQY